MQRLTRTRLGNLLLRGLPQEDFEAVAPHLEPVKLSRGLKLASPEAPISHVYFPSSGMGSMVTVSPGGHQVEVGLFGREGMGPVGPVLGQRATSNQVFVQLPGHGHRVALEPFISLLQARNALRERLGAYVMALIAQTCHTALSHAVHTIDQRLARWILMCDDRVEASEIPLTHDYVSLMIGVRRPSITLALHVLEGERLIRSERGCIIVRDRKALEQFAADSYGGPEAVYRTLCGPFPPERAN